MTCTEKWFGKIAEDEMVIVNVRPDGYVGSFSRWDSAVETSGTEAAKWVDDYYAGFLQVPE